MGAESSTQRPTFLGKSAFLIYVAILPQYQPLKRPLERIATKMASSQARRDQLP